MDNPEKEAHSKHNHGVSEEGYICRVEGEMSDGDGSSDMTGRSRDDRSTGLHKLTSYHLSTANEPAKFQIDRRFMFLVLKHIPQIVSSFR